MILCQFAEGPGIRGLAGAGTGSLAEGSCHESVAAQTQGAEMRPGLTAGAFC